MDDLHKRHLLASLIGGFVVLLGCGGTDGPVRYERKGTVTFHGQPVAKGEIIIVPDTAKGAIGPGTTVTFENGKYRTRNGMGTLSGPHVVTLSGYDGSPGKANATTEPHPWGAMLFVRHRVEINFPAEDSQHDFDIKE